MEAYSSGCRAAAQGRMRGVKIFVSALVVVMSIACLSAAASRAQSTNDARPEPEVDAPPVDSSPMASIAYVYRLSQRGRINQAIEFLEKYAGSPNDRRAVVEARSIELGLLAKLYAMQARYAAAEQLYRDIISYGSEISKASGRHDLGDLLSAIGRNDDARLVWEELDKQIASAGSSASFYNADSPLALGLTARLARAYALIGRWPEAHKYAAKADEFVDVRLKKSLREVSRWAELDPWRVRTFASDFNYFALVASTASVYVSASLAPENLSAAIAKQQAGMGIIERLQAVLSDINSKVRAVPIDQVRDKETLRQGVLTSCESCLLIVPLQHLAMLYQRNGDLQAAEDNQRRARSLAIDQYGRTSPQLVIIDENLASTLARQNNPEKYPEAIRLREEALQRRLSMLEPTVLSNIQAMEALAQLDARAGQLEAADEMLRRANAARGEVREVGVQNVDRRYQRQVQVLFGTTRARDTVNGVASFGSQVSDRLLLGVADIRAPYLERKAGVFARPLRLGLPGTSVVLDLQSVDPLRHFALRSTENASIEELVFKAREAISRAKSYRDTAVVFVHGFQTRFDEAAMWFAQILEDIGYDGAAFLFSWPSKGEFSASAYNADIDRARNARNALIQFVDTTVRRSGAKKVHLVAHSMGGLPLLTALREMRQRQVIAGSPAPIFDQVIFAAPDVERNEFIDLIQESKGVATGVTLYAASTDLAMVMSRRHRGNDSPRAGDVGPVGPVIAPGLDTIDVSAVAHDFFSVNHSHFSEKVELLRDIRMLLEEGKGAAARAGSSNLVRGANGAWEMRAGR